MCRKRSGCLELCSSIITCACDSRRTSSSHSPYRTWKAPWSVSTLIQLTQVSKQGYFPLRHIWQNGTANSCPKLFMSNWMNVISCFCPPGTCALHRQFGHDDTCEACVSAVQPGVFAVKPLARTWKNISWTALANTCLSDGSNFH